MKLGLVVSSIVVAACSSPERARPAVAHAAPPVAPPIATPVPAQAPATLQTFAETDPGYAFSDPQRRAKLEAAFPKIEAAVEDELQKSKLPGVAIGVVIDGELAYAKGFGVTDLATKTRPDADTMYRIGSISKSFTALAILALRDEGALQLDDPLAKWIPEAGGLVYPSRDSRPLTLRQLMNHTSGLPRMGTFDFEHDPSEELVVKSLAGLKLENAPGTAHVYSNLGFALLGIVVGRASHSSLHDVVGKRIFGPLGMTATAYERTKIPASKLATAYDVGPAGPVPKPDSARLGAAGGAGGIYSSVRDMARYAAFQMSAYPPRDAADTGAIRRATLREAHSTGVAAGAFVAPVAQPKQGKPTADLHAMTYGSGWVEERGCDYTTIWHNGAIDSYRADLRFLPTRGIGVVMLTNFVEPNAVTQRVIDELLATGAAVERKQRPNPALDKAFAQFLVVYNEWNEDKYKAMLDPHRPDLLAVEKAEVAGYRALHGTCKSGTMTEGEGSAAKFAMQCERGKLEMEISLAPGGGIAGFGGVSTDVSPPPVVAKAIESSISLIAKWDDAIYKKHLTKIAPLEQVKKIASELRAQHGSCKIREAKHVTLDWTFTLECTRGGGLGLDATPNADKPEVLDKLLVHPPVRGPGAGSCPLR